MTSQIQTKAIGNSIITYAKIQNETALTLLGNPTGSSAAPSEITLGTGLSFSGSVLNSGGGSTPAATATTAGTITRELIWTNYSATITGAGTTTNQSVFYKILGDSLFIRGYFTTGTVAAIIASCSIPSGLTISSAKLPINNITTASGANLGTWENSQEANQFGNMISATGTSTSIIYFGGLPVGGNGGIGVNGSSVWASNSNVSFFCEIPLV